MVRRGEIGGRGEGGGRHRLMVIWNTGESECGKGWDGIDL